MVRVPNTLPPQTTGASRDIGIAPELPLHTMSDQEVGAFITRCAAALRSYGQDLHAGHETEDAFVAFQSTLALLLEVRDVYPQRQAEIDNVLARNGWRAPPDRA